MRALLRTHWPLVVVLVAAAVVRVGVAIAYWPAVFFGDSWAYLNLAYEGGFAPDRPSGYPQALHLLSVFGRDLGTITIAQHLAGLVTGVLVYALMLRLRLPRWLATVGAAVVVLDAYAIALEQQILAEAFFTLALVASFFFVVGRDRAPVALARAACCSRWPPRCAPPRCSRCRCGSSTSLWSHRALRLVAPAVLGTRRPAARLLELARRGHRAASASPRQTAGSCTAGWGRSPTAATPTSRATRARSARATRGTGARARRTTSGTPTARRAACSAA